jgi:cation diffusion facilitator family transporter
MASRHELCAGARVSERRTVVYAAIAANVTIAVIKFVAATLSGSSALFSEGLHSLIDTGDGLLLLLGMHLSHRPPTRRHPYGHDAEIYFWSMIVAMSIFGIGGGLSIYEGIQHLVEPRAPRALIWGYGTLGVAFVFEGASWLISIRGFRRINGTCGVWDAIRASKDPTSFAVLLEDSAALIGIVLAAAGITLAHVLDQPAWDAVASILIGVLLVGVGGILGRETWSLLLGESASAEVVESIRAIACAEPGVRDARPPRTMHLGPDLVHVDLDLEVEPGAPGIELSRRIEAAVRARHPQVQRVSFRFPEPARS